MFTVCNATCSCTKLVIEVDYNDRMGPEDIRLWCHGVVDSTCDTEFGGTSSIPSHDAKVNSAFHPFEVDK